MRSIISDLLDEFPKIRSALNRMRYGRFLLWRIKVKTKNCQEQSPPNIALIHPERIRHYLVEKPPRLQVQGTSVAVLSGDWDLLLGRIGDLNGSEMLDRKLQDESSVEGDENGIAVAIGRNGDLLLTNGMRALLTARKFPTQQIPIAIIARHSKWQELREELIALTLEKRLYQPSTHPDCDLPNEFYRERKDYCERRFDVINENLSTCGGKLLDIGTAFGYFCHRFEEIGFECYAVEDNLTELYYLRKLRRAESREFRIIPQDVLKWSGVEDVKFDVVLALNILHHFLKRRKTYEGLINLLNKLQTKEMFFESHIYDEPQMKNSYKNYTDEEFVEFILQNSALKNARLIGTAPDGRKLYKLF
jgi:2-polyprenyl-3-methyl-5-hydroxy-6-metoxy-1,4-benzoquinol methylase